MTQWPARASLASFLALTAGVLGAVLLHPDGDGAAGWILGVGVNAALICFAATLFAQFVSRR